ncbi:MAG: SRPBCC domain-containing protein [Bacteroidetes bacterium]|jgi:uncharacterized protein YndB with AHSA1/START domain|nr:SRPBCC domain-containing protein [Bacteroidota bacterium]
MKNKLTFEYPINSSPKVLYTRLSTPGGLAEWFADDVNQNGDVFSFIWDNSEEKAELVNKKENKYVRFKWLEDEDEESYFEFRINIDDLTGDVALMITDFADKGEEEESRNLWDTQIAELKHILGL